MATIKKTEEEIRAEIIEASSKLFMKYGYGKTTMEDIAKAVRKGKSTLYYYYKSKEDVIIDVLQTISKQLFDKIEERIQSELCAKTRLNIYFSATANEIESVIELYEVLRNELREDLEIQRRIRVVFNDQSISQIKAIIRYGIERGEFKELSDYDIDNISFVIDTAITSFVLTLTIEMQMQDWKPLFIKYGDLLLNGIAIDN